MLCEEFAYTHAPECVFVPKGLTMLPVHMDEHGMIPSHLRQYLDSFGSRDRDSGNNVTSEDGNTSAPTTTGTTQHAANSDTHVTAGEPSSQVVDSTTTSNRGGPASTSTTCANHSNHPATHLSPHKQGPHSTSQAHIAHTTSSITSSTRKPRVLYIIPNGQNPTGAVMPLERKKEIYQICCDHDVIILEDDAYYWLQYPHGPDHPPGQQLPPSFLSLDTQGRVIRIDTFAKLLGPG